MQDETALIMLERISSDKQIYIPLLEALLFASETPISVPKIREIISDLTPKEISLVVEYLNYQYRMGRRSFEIKEIAGGYQMFTLPEFSEYVEKLYQSKLKSRLTQKSLETLAIIAYKQPITKHEIEDIRGVNVDGVVKTLLSRSLTTIAGRVRAPGSPFLYKTTSKFLEYFGLNSLEDLPNLKELDALINVEDETHPRLETLLKEIDLDELGLKSNGSDANDLIGEDSDGKEKDPA